MMTPFKMPRHVSFQDKTHGEVALIQEGDWKGWLFRHHVDGGWVSLRLATKDDLEKVERVIAVFN